MILWRASIRHALHHRWQTALAIVGVALGVGVVTAVDLANESAHRAFRLAAETVAGRATHHVVAGLAGLPDTLYRTLRITHHIRAAAPVVEGYVQVAGHAGTSLRLIGVDPFAEPPIRSFSSQFSTPKVMETLLAVPNTGVMLRQTAARLRVEEGSIFNIQANGIKQPIMLAGFLEPPDELTRAGLEPVLVTDIATAQELLAMQGHISRIDLVTPEGDAGKLLLSEIAKVLPAGKTIVPAGSRAGALEQMTRAFRLNLTALSLLAVVVGMFLIYNTITFSVIRRRRLIGLLRAIGVTRREIFALMATEVLLIGIAGTGAGLLFGILLGEEVTRLVTRTINDLYFNLEVHDVRLLPLTFVKAAVLGLGATIVAALPPMIEATGATPRAALSRSV
ncbi:MAG: ABC transporter permease, partial [Geobacter sp.]